MKKISQEGILTSRGSVFVVCEDAIKDAGVQISWQSALSERGAGGAEAPDRHCIKLVFDIVFLHHGGGREGERSGIYQTVARAPCTSSCCGPALRRLTHAEIHARALCLCVCVCVRGRACASCDVAMRSSQQNSASIIVN